MLKEFVVKESTLSVDAKREFVIAVLKTIVFAVSPRTSAKAWESGKAKVFVKDQIVLVFGVTVTYP